MPSVEEFRAQYPQYEDIPDEDFLKAVRKKVYPQATDEDWAKILSAPQPEVSNQDPNSLTFNPDRESGSLLRLALGFKLSNKGKVAYGDYAGQKLFADETGNLYQVDPDKKEYFPVDNPNALNMKDVADFGGDLLSAGPVAGGTKLAQRSVLKRMAGAAGGAALGEAGLQAIDAMTPGGSDVGVTERAGRLASSAALGGLTQGFFDTGTKLLSKAKELPGNIAAGALLKKEGSAFAKEGRALEKATGVDYTPGQRTGSRGLLTLEGYFRRSPMTADVFWKNDARQLAQSTQALDKVLELSFGSSAGGPSAMGKAVSGAFDNAFNKALSMRRAQASRDFDKVTQLSGNRPVIPVGNVLNEIDRMITELDIPGGGDATATLIKKLKSLKNAWAGRPIEASIDLPTTNQMGQNLIGDGPMTMDLKASEPHLITAEQAKRALQLYGRIAAGTGDLFHDVSAGQQRWVAGNISRALQQDLDGAASIGEGELVKALRGARDNYKVNSVAIDDLEASFVGRILGPKMKPSDDNLTEAILRMSPDEMKQTYQIINGVNPDLGQKLKRAAFERAMERAGVPSPGINIPDKKVPGGRGEPLWSPAKLASEIRKSKGVWSILDPEERLAMTTITHHLDRLSDRAGTDGSPTQPLMEVSKAVKAASSGITGPLWHLVQWAGRRKLAKMLVSRQGQKALMTLSRNDPRAPDWLPAMAYLSGELAMPEDQAPTEIPQGVPQ